MAIAFDRNPGLPAPTQVMIGVDYVNCIDTHPLGCHVYKVMPQFIQGDGILSSDSIAYCWQQTEAYICPLALNR